MASMICRVFKKGCVCMCVCVCVCLILQFCGGFRGVEYSEESKRGEENRVGQIKEMYLIQRSPFLTIRLL